ncbi:MAG: fumarylacetoacetate hydrolase family protein [Gammaproteobacteria bacterium]|nr:fumarylacetoacetate hydrolase family protein [Gammaproteobacteria bacterium]
MRRILTVCLAVLLIAVVAVVVAAAVVSGSIYDEQIDTAHPRDHLIAPANFALTFARVATASGNRIILVQAFDSASISGVDLNARFDAAYDSPVAIYRRYGYAALAALAATGPASHFTTDSLILPVDFAAAHIAAGTNFRAHAEEVMIEDGPFLFPKLVTPTGWDADVPEMTRLDYEVELCAIPLEDVATASRTRTTLGFLLCGDFTERWTLIRDIDLDAPMGTTGFVDAKGQRGSLPVGSLLVIPRDAQSFIDEVDIELYVNGELRQRSAASQMIWRPQQILEVALNQCARTYHRASGTVPLTDCSAIPARTLILTGTPAGVSFHVLNIWYPGAYLQPGDRVLSRGTYLGVLDNTIRSTR